MAHFTKLVVATLIVGCSVPNAHYEPVPDGATVDAPDPNVQRIVISMSALDVDEGSATAFTVALALPPASPLLVELATTSPKLALDVPELMFGPDTFDQPQTVHAVGLVDPDTQDDHANIVVAAVGVDPVTMTATIHDHDLVQIVTDVGAGVISVDEQSTATIHVHLSAQPTTNVIVNATVGAGPVTLSPSTLTFTPQNYATDQTVTLTAPDDTNIVSEVESLAFGATGVPTQQLSIHDIDNDTLNLSVNPASLAIIEQGAAGTLNVALTQQPSANVVVAITTSNGAVNLDVTQLTFTPQNYLSTQAIHVTAPDDPDTADGADIVHLNASGLAERTISVAIKDNDVQTIVEDAPSPLHVTENLTNTFHVSLKYQPTVTTTVSVTSLDASVATASPGVLTFTPSNYLNPQIVTVHGTDDNNVITNLTAVRLFEASIGTVDVATSVADDDTQAFVVSAATLNVGEGNVGTFDVSLKYDPSGTVTANLASTNATAIPVTPPSIAFTTNNYTTPVHVSLSPPVDANMISETATITISGAGAANATVMATVVDYTMLSEFGFPAPFGATATIPTTLELDLKVTIGFPTTLSAFGAYTPGAAGDFRMALYTDNSGVPGTLVAQMPARVALANGVNTIDIPDVAIGPGSYWIALRVAQGTPLGTSAAPASTVCSGPAPSSLDTAWPAAHGSCTVSATASAINLWIDTYHQPLI